MSYDDWKTHNEDDDRCEYCGATLKHGAGWQPDQCTGDCRVVWRDPDAEYEKMRDDHE
jgi:hypothetical protein